VREQAIRRLEMEIRIPWGKSSSSPVRGSSPGKLARPVARPVARYQGGPTSSSAAATARLHGMRSKRNSLSSLVLVVARAVVIIFG
jgi:hypothetical protein